MFWRLRLARVKGRRRTSDGAELFHDISHDSIVGRGRRSENRDGRRERPQYPDDSPVIWPEVVSPVQNTVSFVYNEEADSIGEGQEASGDESSLACRPARLRARRFHPGASRLQSPPFRLVRRIDCLRSNSYPSGRSDRVPHERQERRDQNGAARGLIAKKSCGKKIHEALAPSCPLDHEGPRPAPNQSGDRLPLSVAEGRSIVAERLPKKWSARAGNKVSPPMVRKR